MTATTMNVRTNPTATYKHGMSFLLCSFLLEQTPFYSDPLARAFEFGIRKMLSLIRITTIFQVYTKIYLLAICFLRATFQISLIAFAHPAERTLVSRCSYQYAHVYIVLKCIS